MPFPSRGLRANPRVVGFIVLVCSLYLAYIAGQWVLEGGIRGLALRIAEFVAVVIVLMVLVRWRLGILFFLVWLTFEDLPRKYMGNNMQIYFLKDLLVTVVYAAYLVAVMKRREKLFRPVFWVPLLALISLALAQMFNPQTTSFYYGLLGMKLYFYYVPLMFLGYSLLCSQEDIDRFFSFNLKVAGIVALVGIVQGLGWKNFLNPANLAPSLQALGHLYRYAPGVGQSLQAPPSIFVSQGRFANYLELMFTMSLGVAAFQLFRRRKAEKITYLVLGLVGVAIFLSGSKSAMVYAILTLVGLACGLLWGVRNQPWISVRLGKIMRRSVLALAASFCLIVAFFPSLMNAWGTYYYDLLSPESSTSVLGLRTGTYPLNEFEKTLDNADWTIGYGTGTASLGVQYVTGLLHAPEPPAESVENGYGDLIIELGVLGPILWIVMAGTLIISGWKVARRLVSTPLYPLALSIVWYAFWVLFPLTWADMSAYQNFVVNAYLWTLVGILFRLPFLTAGNEPRSAAVPVARVIHAAVPVRVG